jgi:hypothetical protein
VLHHVIHHPGLVTTLVSLHCMIKTWGLSGKFPKFFSKIISFTWELFSLVPFEVVSSTPVHCSQHFFWFWKHFWNAFCGIACSFASEFSWMFSTGSKHQPFNVNFSFRNKKKSAGVRSDNYSGSGMMALSSFTRKSWISSIECAGALWWSIHFSPFKKRAFFFPASRRHLITSR